MAAYLQAFAFKTVDSNQFRDFFSQHFASNPAGTDYTQQRPGVHMPLFEGAAVRWQVPGNTCDRSHADFACRTEGLLVGL
jgi:hypothetical protein